MARKINVKLILELRAAGLSRNAIADTRHISRHSVSDVFAVADKMGVTYEDIRGMEDNEAYRLIFPEKHPSETLYGDPDYEHVHKELKKTGVTLKLLWEEYKNRCSHTGEIPIPRLKEGIDGQMELGDIIPLTNTGEKEGDPHDSGAG